MMLSMHLYHISMQNFTKEEYSGIVVPNYRIGIVYYFCKGSEALNQVTLREGDPPAEVMVAGASVTVGIYNEVVPSDTHKNGGFEEIQLPRVNGLQVFPNKDVHIFGEPELLKISASDSPEERSQKFAINKQRQADSITCRVTILTPPLRLRKHPEGKVCGECIYFNRQRGQEELKNVTHQYQNGSLAMTEEIIKQICDLERKPNLTKDIVGHCPVNQELCAETSPACEEFAPPTSPEAQVPGKP